MVVCPIMNVLRVKRKCLELLERVERDGAYLNLLLQEEAKKPTIAPDEYPLLVQLTRGTLEQTGTIDATLAPFLSQGIASLPSQVRNVLRLGTYQIQFLERSKKRDVVFEAVEIVKNGKFQGFSKLVNAVLRKVEPSSNMPTRSLNKTFRNGSSLAGDRSWARRKPLPFVNHAASRCPSTSGSIQVGSHPPPSLKSWRTMAFRPSPHRSRRHLSAL